MKDNRKKLAIAIMVLIVGAGVVPSINSVSYKMNTIISDIREPYHDVGVKDITEPSGPPSEPWIPRTYPVEAVVKNYGTFNEIDFNVNAKIWKLSEGEDDVLYYEDDSMVTTNMSPGDEVTVVFTDVDFPDICFLWIVTYRMEITTELSDDNVSDNDQKTMFFAIMYSNLPPHLAFNGTMCEGGWFIIPVTVSFSYDPIMVSKIYYQVGSGEWTLYTEPFVIYEQGEIDFLWYWVDADGNQEITESHILRIDYTPPELALITPEKGKIYFFGKLLFEKEFARTIILGAIVIDVAAIDEISGIDNVTFSLVKSSGPSETHVSETLPYIWELTGIHIGKYTLTVTAYDRGGLSVNTTIDMIIIQLGVIK